MPTDILEYAAFTYQGKGGNPAGVVLDAADLTPTDMLQIAADLGYSESAFVVDSHGDRQVQVRYFSPLAEVAFCGHATVATAVALAERHGVGPFSFATAVGAISLETARTADNDVVATLTSVPTHTRPATDDELDRSLAALRWTREHLDPRYPAHVAFGGMEHLIVAVRDREVLADLDYDYEALDAIMAERGWITLQLIWAETPTLFHARDPFPPGGVVEDPATGAAAAALGGYLRDLELVEPHASVTVLQGFDHGTPSRLLVEPDPSSGRVRVTGSANSLRPARS